MPEMGVKSDLETRWLGSKADYSAAEVEIVLRRIGFTILGAATVAAGAIVTGGGVASALAPGVTCVYTTCTNNSGVGQTISGTATCEDGSTVLATAYVPAHGTATLTTGRCPDPGVAGAPYTY
jgi:hypothetical protein